ncbi:hypothetical protein [Streptomyces sp. NPDC090798]|uniref:hypothetical protein n=1 Tax=Streptomyces sp. NPDC090798 TaxID=3365968 RepID=UPI003816B50C
MRSLELALLQVKRDTLTDLRDAGRIDDIVQEALDVEEARLERSHAGRGPACGQLPEPVVSPRRR